MARVSIEDCLNVMENRFALVLIAADRTRQLMDGKESLVRSRNKQGVTALREIADKLVLPLFPVDDDQHNDPLVKAAQAQTVLDAAPAAPQA
jgi:DNA-directed RNA polymerase omega subunit